jgi:hypothetical protein
MANETSKLSKILNEIWGRQHHIFPSRRSRTILKWYMYTEESNMIAGYTDEFGAESRRVFPAYWADADGTVDIERHVKWNTGWWY